MSEPQKCEKCGREDYQALRFHHNKYEQLVLDELPCKECRINLCQQVWIGDEVWQHEAWELDEELITALVMVGVKRLVQMCQDDPPTAENHWRGTANYYRDFNMRSLLSDIATSAQEF